MSVLDRRLTRGAVVVVGVVICLFGSSRLAADRDASNGHTGSAVAASGSVFDGGEHATTPRSPISLSQGWMQSLGLMTVVGGVAAVLPWTLVAADRRRVTVVPLAASWRRRGPPISLR